MEGLTSFCVPAVELCRNTPVFAVSAEGKYKLLKTSIHGQWWPPLGRFGEIFARHIIDDMHTNHRVSQMPVTSELNSPK